MPKKSHLAAFVMLAFISIVASSAQAEDGNAGYSLVDTLHLSGPTRWDYLAFDPDRKRLFITRGDSVDVVDTATRKIIGSIANTTGVHGVALAPSLGRGFTSNGKANTATIFDLATLQVVSTVPTGTKPDAIAYDPATQRVFTANGESDDMTAINAKNGAVLDTIKLGGQPEFAVVDGEGRLYVNLEDKSQLTVVDTRSLKVLAHYDYAPKCEGPTGLSIDVSRHRVFAVCANKTMLVVDAATGKIIDALPIGEHSDASVFDPAANLAFSSNGDGTLTVIGPSGPDHYAVLQTVKTLPTARTMALNPSTHEIYLVGAETEGFDPPNDKHPEPRPHIKPDTFMVLTVAPKIKHKTSP